MRRCANCTEHKPESEFYRRSGGYLSSYCKPCQRTRFRKTPEQNAATVARYRAKHPEKDRRRRLRSNLKLYGMTLEQYEAMRAAQGGRCAICDRAATAEPRGRLYVDHDHRTGKVRALLCKGCNAGLGCFRDSMQSLLSAARYLARHTGP